MNTKSLSRELLDKLKLNKSFMFGGTLEDYARTKFGNKGSSSSRILRYLAREGKVDKTYEWVGKPTRKCVMYRIKK